MEENVTTNINLRKRRYQYVKGLLMRIIIACTLFILLFFSNLLSVDVLDYNTKKIVTELQNNSLIESIQDKIGGMLN